jgi:hypothetical protein
MRFDNAHVMWIEHRDRFRYVIEMGPFAELRKQAQGPDAAQPNAKTGFLISGRFLETLGDLLPENQNQARFRYLGRIGASGGSLVLAFAKQDGTRQGLVWVDDATKEIVRCRTDLLNYPEGEVLDHFTRDVRFVLVNFSASTALLSRTLHLNINFAKTRLLG